MATITLKNIPDKLYEQLKHSAKISRRSLNSEIIYNLEKSLGLIEEDPHNLRKEIDEFRNQVARRGQLSPEEIEGAINTSRP